jgi:diacylglycerol kinase (ATP)
MRPDTTSSVLAAHGPSEPAGASAVAARDVDLVVNANATGAGSTADVVARATHALERAGAHVRAHVTGSETELAAVAANAAGRLVLVGGDGTVHALANVGLPTLPEAALLPAGRANNVARALGFPVDWSAAAQLAAHGHASAVDALRVTTPQRELYAVEGVSAGFHAAARHRYTATNSGDLVAGVHALVAELATFRPHRVALDVDGAPSYDGAAAQIFLSNLPYFGFGFHVDPDADPSDGRLEAIVLEGTTRRDVVRLLAAARDGRHLGRPGVTLTRATEARTRRPLPLVADAVPLGVTTAVITVAPARLTLVTPEARS